MFYITALLLTFWLRSNSACDLASSGSFAEILQHEYGAFTQENMLPAEKLTTIYSEILDRREGLNSSANCTLEHSVQNAEQWDEFSTMLLFNLLSKDVADFDVTDNSVNYKDALFRLITNNSYEGSEIKEAHFENFLKNLEEILEQDENHEDHKSHENDCFGESVLLHRLGMSHEDILSRDSVGRLAGYIISYVTRDYHLMEDCPVYPSQCELITDLFKYLGGSENIEKLSEKGFEKLLSELSLVKSENAAHHKEEESEQGGHDDHAGHNHKKRSINTSQRIRRSVEESPVEQCLEEPAYANMYNLDFKEGITSEQFSQLCPALIQQQVGGYCDQAEATTTKKKRRRVITDAQLYGYGTLAVFIISLLALAGALLIPCLQANVTKYIMSMFVALGVGTILSDGLIHLLPEALGIHEHTGEGLELNSVSQKQIVVACSIYAFFLFELLMGVIKPSMSSRPARGHSHTVTIDDRDELKSYDSKQTIDGSSTQTLAKSKKPTLPALAVLIVIGDSLHNMLDGLAIGVAFANSLEDGIATSIAIFCHELPHELGDFAILLHAGASKTKAILFNLFSACMCFVGLYIGAALGSDEVVRQWIFAVTAGMFIYVALVDMLPELLEAQQRGNKWIYFVVHNIGILLGMGVIIILSAAEGRLEALLI